MILDHIENLRFDSESEDYLYDAQMTLARISRGLFWLNDAVSSAEQQSRQEAEMENVEVGVVEGVLKDLPMDWLSCAFQWYAVSLYNYVRLAGWLIGKDKKFALAYVDRVIPRVTAYRHKVAAHFAITFPRDDNEADLISSVNTSIVYAHGYLRAGALSEVVTDADGNEITASIKMTWSMTKVHQRLMPRYWPKGPLDAYSSIRISAGATRKFIVDWED